MASTFNLEDYACPRDKLPEVLWRVTHSNSQQDLSRETGDIRARRQRLAFDEETLSEAAANHFDWYCPEPSCFLSVFDKKDHARRWAQKVRNNNGGDRKVYITRIVTAMLPANTLVFKATELSRKLGIHHQYSADELIFLNRIPWQSLGRPRSLEDGSPEKDSVSAPVQALQELHDTIGPLFSNRKATNNYLRHVIGPNGTDVVRGEDYKAAMKDVVLAFARAASGILSERPGPCQPNSVLDFLMFLCRNRQEEEEILQEFVEETASPGRGVENPSIDQPGVDGKPETEVEGNIEVLADKHGSEGTETDIPDISGLTLVDG